MKANIKSYRHTHIFISQWTSFSLISRNFLTPGQGEEFPFLGRNKSISLQMHTILRNSRKAVMGSNLFLGVTYLYIYIYTYTWASMAQW